MASSSALNASNLASMQGSMTSPQSFLQAENVDIAKQKTSKFFMVLDFQTETAADFPSVGSSFGISKNVKTCCYFLP